MNIRKLIEKNEHMYYFEAKRFDITFYNKNDFIVKRTSIAEKLFRNIEDLIVEKKQLKNL